jgi:hypothetical protein
MSINVSKLAKRSFIMGRRLCPPATSRADSPSFNNEIAWSTEVARAYLNGAGTCIAPTPSAPTNRGAEYLNRYLPVTTTDTFPTRENAQ